MAKKETPQFHVNISGMTINHITIYFDDGGKELEKTCPKCNKRKPISEFGLRAMREKEDQVVVRLQPWCGGCR